MIWYSTESHLIESKSQVTEQNSLFLNFTPEVLPTKKKDSKSPTAYRVNGVNILNRKNLDSKTIIERIQRRKENHNHIEKRRRSTMNEIILELSKTVPGASLVKQKPNKANILKQALAHIQDLQAQNKAIKQQLAYSRPNHNHFPHSQHNSRRFNVSQPTNLHQTNNVVQSKHSNVAFKPYPLQSQPAFFIFE